MHRRSAAKGSSIGKKRASAGSCGVLPPRWNHAMPRTVVSPIAKMLIATQLTTWLPRLVTLAKPCIIEKTTPTIIAPNSPSHADCVQCATQAAMNAPPSILPSSPKSMTPERSANIPAIAANTKGAAVRKVASSNKMKSNHMGGNRKGQSSKVPKFQRSGSEGRHTRVQNSANSLLSSNSTGRV